MRFQLVCVTLWAAMIVAAGSALADEAEMKDGRKLTGLVLIRSSETILFRVIKPDGSTENMMLPAREVVSIKESAVSAPARPESPKPVPPKPGPPKPEPSPVAPAPGKPDPPATSQPGKPAERTREEIDALVEKAGRAQPDWWGSVKAPVLAGLDLVWPDKPTPGKNLGQYFRLNFDHRPARYKEACKLLQDSVLLANKDSKQGRFWAATKLGQYYSLMHDYALGAFWYRTAVKDGALRPMEATYLANCYWKLGNKEMAKAELDKAGTNTMTLRLLGEIGDVARALDLAKGIVGDWGNLLAGDICRYNGDYKAALSWYSKSAGGAGNRIRDLCAASVDAMKAFEAFDLKKLDDGTYTGESGGGFRGPVKVSATVKGGQITEVKVGANTEDWPLNALVAIPAQIIEKQSIKGIDTVTGATFTSDAVLNAAAKALGNGIKK